MGEGVVWRCYYVRNVCAVVRGCWLWFNICSEWLQVVGGWVYVEEVCDYVGQWVRGFLFIE